MNIEVFKKDLFNRLMAAQGFYCGRMISGSKKEPKGHFCVWNANIVAESFTAKAKLTKN